MNSIHLYDDENIDFVPKTFQDAVLLFNRRKKELSDPQNTPELLQHCCRELDQNEFNKFYTWVVSPSGEYKDPGPNVEYVDDERDEKEEKKED